MKKLLTCPVCGGHLKLNTETGIATCESCGEPREADAAEVKKLLDTCSRAERYTRQNTAAGYREGIRLLKSIAADADVADRIAAYETQLGALTQRQTRQHTVTESTGKKDTAVGIVLLVVLAVIVLAVIAGVVTLIVLWAQGKLSPTTVTVILCVLAVLAVLVIIGKAKSGL